MLSALAVMYVGASLICFALYARDKAAARAGRQRTPESTLLWLGLACGWPGGVLAQRYLRHKTNKASFQWRFWLTVVANLLAVACVLLAPMIVRGW